MSILKLMIQCTYILPVRNVTDVVVIREFLPRSEARPVEVSRDSYPMWVVMHSTGLILYGPSTKKACQKFKENQVCLSTFLTKNLLTF